MNIPLLWFRTEHKPGERRSLATPEVVSALRSAGFKVTVEDNPAAGLSLDALRACGAEIAPAGAWREAPEQAMIIGLKELDPKLGPFRHEHVHFAHAFKYQSGWELTLGAFREGGGRLYDLEYLVDDDGKRLAAFGYFAGFVGAALAVQAYGAQALKRTPSLQALTAWSDTEALLADSRQALAGVDAPLSAAVIGARGRSGGGALEALNSLGVSVSQWDVRETAVGGPFPSLLEHDLLINCVLLGNEDLPPFLTSELLDDPSRRLRVIADVSCDPASSNNPLPIYTEVTTLEQPVMRLRDVPPLDLIAIDHLPSLLPGPASARFAAELLPFLIDMQDCRHGPWARAQQLFQQRLSELD